LLTLMVSGRATTTQTRSVEKSGFLGDYSMLEEGDGDDAADSKFKQRFLHHR